MFELPFPTKHADILGLWSQAKYRPEQHAEHVKMGQEIAAYCHSHDIHDLDGFLAAAENDPSVLRFDPDDRPGLPGDLAGAVR